MININSHNFTRRPTTNEAVAFMPTDHDGQQKNLKVQRFTGKQKTTETNSPDIVLAGTGCTPEK